jgi:hypothetical protein
LTDQAQYETVMITELVYVTATVTPMAS